MSVLLGLELVGREAILTVVNRDAEIEGVLVEPLSSSVSEWWLTHPDERWRALLSLLDTAMSSGLLEGGAVAGIGLAAEPALVLLDRELSPIPPREIKWESLLEPGATLGPAAALRLLAAERAGTVRKTGAVLSLLDYLRFRFTGALASHESFAWQLGLSAQIADEGGGWRLGQWSQPGIQELGFSPEAFPPIFESSARVGIVGGEAVEQTGLPNGTWVHAGSDPRTNCLVFAQEPRAGTCVSLLTETGAESWRVGPAPTEWSEDVLPTSLPDTWFHRLESPVDPRQPEWALPDGVEQVALDFRYAPDLEHWPSELPASVQMACDAGRASAGAAVHAGLGCGWWRDSRVLWRKKLRPSVYSDWRDDVAHEQFDEEGAEVPPEEASSAAD